MERNLKRFVLLRFLMEENAKKKLESFLLTLELSVNKPNVWRTVREPFNRMFVYVRSLNKRTSMNKEFRSIN
ncbi:hypothetical protein Hanom_Chr04g00383621 [Helianthus anomalus]